NATPDLTITKDDGLTTGTPGQTVTYTSRIRRHSKPQATWRAATCTPPAGTTFVSASNGGTILNGVVTWTIGPLASGATVTRTVKIGRASRRERVDGTVVAEANVADDGSKELDPTPRNHTVNDKDVRNAAT